MRLGLNGLVAVAVVGGGMAGVARGTGVKPTLVATYPAPGAASEMVYSSDYGLLFMRNSGAAIRVFDTVTHSQVDVRLANATFTDIDLSPDGKYLYAADHGATAIGYGGVLTTPHYLHRYNLATRAWEVEQSTVDTYKIEAVDANRVLVLESDQWVDVNLVQWTGGAAATKTAGISVDYYGDIEYDPATGRIYHGNSGLSSQQITVRRLVGDTLSSSVGTGIYGSAQGYGGTAVLSLDGERFYYGRLQVEALDVTNNIRVFPQPIYAATADLAFGSSSVYDTVTGADLGGFGYSTTVYALNAQGNALWTYSNNVLYQYSVVPEPAAGALAAVGLAAAGRRRRR